MTQITLLKNALLIAATFAATNAIALDAQQIFERVSPSVVVIKAGDSQGSGVVYAVDNKGLTPSSTILTNCHVVKGHSQVTVERLGKTATGFVKVCDSDRDMAVITLGGALPTVQLRRTPLKVGEPAFAVGAPQGLELSISQGIVSQLRPTPLGKDPVIQTTAAISKGSSGGGLFDSEGSLIGLTTLQHKDGQSLNFAVPINFFALLKHTPVNRPLVTPSPSAAAPKPSTASPEPRAVVPRQQQCGWTLVGLLDSMSYIDYCKITEVGRYRFAWTMNDFKVARQSADKSYAYSSDVVKKVYDCQQSRSAITEYSDYQGQMAQGALMRSRSFLQNEWDFRERPGIYWDKQVLEKICSHQFDTRDSASKIAATAAADAAKAASNAAKAATDEAKAALGR